MHGGGGRKKLPSAKPVLACMGERITGEARGFLKFLLPMPRLSDNNVESQLAANITALVS